MVFSHPPVQNGRSERFCPFFWNEHCVLNGAQRRELFFLEQTVQNQNWAFKREQVFKLERPSNNQDVEPILAKRTLVHRPWCWAIIKSTFGSTYCVYWGRLAFKLEIKPIIQHPCKNNWKERPYERRSGRLNAAKLLERPERRSFSKLNIVIVLNDVRSLQKDGTAVWTLFLALERSCSKLNMRTSSAGKQRSDLNKILNNK